MREWNPPYVKWFVGAKCNIVYNALDRHMGTPVQERSPSTGKPRTASAPLSYRELYEDVNRFANALKSLGIKKGDRVVVYLPRIPEQIVAMLAIARIGAVHSVVFSAFTAKALRQRIQDAEAKAVICSDGYQYAGKLVQKKADVDEAVPNRPPSTKSSSSARAGIDVACSRDATTGTTS